MSKEGGKLVGNSLQNDDEKVRPWSTTTTQVVKMKIAQFETFELEFRSKNLTTTLSHCNNQHVKRRGKIS